MSAAGPQHLKVTGIRTVQVRIPFERALRTSIHHIDAVDAVLVFADTDAGITGESYLFAFGAAKLGVLEGMVRSLEHHLIGHDPHMRQRIWAEMWRDINFLGHKGVPVFAVSALDAAAWDIVGKAHGLSVHKMLGGVRNRIRAYSSGGLWVSMTTDELVAEAKAFVEAGFRAMKMRLGKRSVAEDAERVAAVRAAIGPEVELMADANQGFSVSHAIRVGRALEPYHLAWFEEPVQAYDLEGSARVAAEIDTPVASGETEYARYGFADMLERKSADVLMPDLQRVGGISEFMKVAHMAEAKDVPISPHLFTEPCLQLCGAIANCNYAEHMPWFEPLYNERLAMEDGDLLIPDRPGLGFTFDLDAIERYRVTA
jgi:L-alanine-DL-glutamate epimerase-like enolase superfamily enzyme